MTDSAPPADDQPLPPAADGPHDSSPPNPPSDGSTSQEPVELLETDFIDEILFEPRWYLGIAESSAWFIGTLGVHLVCSIFFFVVMLVLIGPHGETPQKAMMDPRVMIGSTAGEMTCFVLAALIAITARYWGRTFKELNMSWPDLRHVMIVVLGTYPLSRLVSLWSIPVQMSWNYITSLVPSLQFLDQMSAMEAVKAMAEVTPLAVMILVIAVLPAIGEEIVFRGAIGRVLICHLGLWSGLLMTSFLFGLIHIHPVHAVTVMPLGLAIHLLYLGSRSFWIPMLLHFENNTLASIMTKIGTDSDAANAPMTLRDGIQIVSALATVIAFGIAMWQSRVRYVDADGIDQDSPLFPVRAPDNTKASRRSGPIGPTCLVIGLVFAVVCHAGLVLEIVDPAQNPDRLPVKEAEVTWTTSESATRDAEQRRVILTAASNPGTRTGFQ